MNLDQLQDETERLLSLLRDRQPVIFAWNAFLRERLEAIAKLTLEAGITPQADEATFARALLSYYRERTRELGEDYMLDDETQDNIDSAIYHGSTGEFDEALTRLGQ